MGRIYEHKLWLHIPFYVATRVSHLGYYSLEIAFCLATNVFYLSHCSF